MHEPLNIASCPLRPPRIHPKWATRPPYALISAWRVCVFEFMVAGVSVMQSVTL